MPRPLGGIDVQDALTVLCKTCGASTWLPLGDLPHGWSLVAGEYFCNLHGVMG